MVTDLGEFTELKIGHNPNMERPLQRQVAAALDLEVQADQIVKDYPYQMIFLYTTPPTEDLAAAMVTSRLE